MFQKNMEIVKLLLEHNFDVNAVGPQNGYTPLHDAVWADNMEAIKLLLDKGARTNIKGKDGLTPYGKAKKEGKKEIIQLFESRGIMEK
jgi:ankyrin repeat protein